MMTDDMDLVREFAARQSEPAFETLVARYINLVYSTALRQTRDPHLAEEITQAVFIILARKAGSFGANTILPAWLHRAAVFAAADALKSQRRRAQREQEAHMQSESHSAETDPAWELISPLLDQALMQLGETDRRAVLLHFFHKKTFAEVGGSLGLSEDSARKRTSRALEKLRKIFSKNGVHSTTSILAGTISTCSVQAAPAALAKAVTVVALTKGAAASITTLSLVKGSLKLMAWGKIKAACGFGAAILLAGTITTMAVAGLKWNKSARYQIEGDLTYHVPGIATNNDQKRHFMLTVDGRNWAVHLSDPKLQANGIQYQEVVQLNGSIYRYDFYGKPAPGAPINSGGAVIESGDFPVEDGTMANYIWLGLASSSYFANRTNGDVMSLFNHPREARTFKVRGEWQLSDQPPYLPVSIDFHTYPSFYPPPFDQGYKEGQLRVLEQTNVGGEVFPQRFTCEMFRPKRNGAATSNDLDLAVTITVQTDAIRLHSIPKILPPKTEGTTAVGESRLTGGTRNDQIVYFSTAPRLPEKPDTKAIEADHPEIARRLADGASRRLQSQFIFHGKWIWSGIALVVAAAGIGAGLFIRRRKD